MTSLDMPEVDRILSSRAPLDVLLVGGAGWGNVGDDAIAESLRQRIEVAGHRVSIAGGPFVRALDGFADHAVMNSSTRERLRLLQAIRRSHLVVVGGGGLLNDRRTAFYRPFTRVADACRMLRVPYAFLAVGVGPIQGMRSARAIRAACNQALAVSVRDEQSRSALVEVGVTAPVRVTTDPAIWLQPVPAPKTMDLCISLRSWGPAQGGPGTVTTSQIIAALAGVLNSLSPRPRVALLGMSYGFDADEESLTELADRLDFPVDTHFRPSVDEVLQVISASRGVVAMRLHACLLAHTAQVPTVGIAYDRKVRNQALVHGFASLTMEEAARQEPLAAAIARVGGSEG